MRKIFALLFGCLLLWGVTDAELAVDINLAGKQRMLTQRMTKDVLMIVAGVETQKAKEDLQKSMELFDRTLKGLMHGDKDLSLVPVDDPKVQAQLQKVQELWNPFKQKIAKVLEGKASSEDIAYIKDRNVELLKEMNKAVQLLVAYSKQGKKEKAQAINLSGKERMLSQRIAKDALLLYLYPKDKVAKKELQASMEEFEKILRGLKEGDSSLGLQKTQAPWIVTELDEAQKRWERLKGALKSFDKKHLPLIVQTSDELLVQMDKITKMYEALLNKRKKISKINSIVDAFVQQKENEKHIINLAGKQRMLTQKMTKEALLSALGIDKQKNLEYLKKDMQLYDKTLRGFLYGDEELALPAAKSKDVKKQIEAVMAVWKPFKERVEHFLKSQDVNDLSYLVANNEKLLKESHQLVQVFKKAYPTNNFLAEARKEIVDIAGRQRMLTQKMTKEKLLMMLGVDKEQNAKKLQQTVALFDNSLKDLINGNKAKKIVRPSNKELLAQLHKVKKLWQNLKPLYEKEKLSAQELTLMVKGNLILLKEMDKAVYLSETVTEY